jgi:hypothetical protein
MANLFERDTVGGFCRYSRAGLSGDHVLIMNNGGCGGIHGKLLAQLKDRHG